MQPSKLSISELFQQREQYLIPLFQRGYVWNLTDQILPLWEDIVDRVDALKQHHDDALMIGGGERLKPLRKHFLGAIIVGSPVSADGAVNTREVIDGQQRTTTLQIMLLALRDVVRPLNDEGLDYDLKGLTNNVGSYRQKSSHLKVWPTNAGRDTMLAIADSGGLDEICERFPVKTLNREKIVRPPMVQAYLLFHAVLTCFLRGVRFDDAASGEEADESQTVAHAVIRSIEKDNRIRVPLADRPPSGAPARLLLEALQSCFQIMRLQLDEEDDPQIIFETLNARGTPLQPSDLIRNFLFLRATRNGEEVAELYDEYWKEYDEKPEPGAGAKGTKFWKKEERQGRLKNSRLDLLLYHYVGLRTCQDLKVAHVFEEFKDWWGENRDIKPELAKVNHLARYFETFVAPDQRSRFGLFCRRLKLLDTATPTPLLFHFLEHHASDSPEFIQVLGDVESYLVRRFVCGLTTKAYNRLFLNRLLGELMKEGQSAMRERFGRG